MPISLPMSVQDIAVTIVCIGAAIALWRMMRRRKSLNCPACMQSGSATQTRASSADTLPKK